MNHSDLSDSADSSGHSDTHFQMPASFLQKQRLWWLCLILSASLLPAQSPDQNLKKYWLYRERLKNFVVVGDCQGCSLQPTGRGGAGNSVLSYNDSGGHMGFYIGMLATEYKLLKDHGQFAQLQKTSMELYYALEALNRLDQTAEYWWRYYFLGMGASAPSNPQDLNGFLISDDAPHSYLDTFYNGDYIENYLNKGLVPPPDNFRLKDVDSGFTYYTDRTSCGQPIGPRETSLDHLTYQLVGLALVSKLIDVNDVAFKPFADGALGFVQEVKNITARISDHLQSGGWFHINPVTGQCVYGVTWTDHCHDDPSQCPCPSCDGGGAIMALFAHGYAACNSHIQAAPNFSSDATASGYYVPKYGGDNIVAASRFTFDTLYRAKSIGKEDYKVLTYASIANIWGGDTSDILGHRCGAVYAEHLPLLHQVLYGSSNLLPAGLYTCLLDSAPCFGNNDYDGNYEWGNGDRVYYGPNVDGNNYLVESAGVDYMLYFNLFLLANPGYLSAVPYHFIPPTELCPDQLDKHDYTESDAKNFLAAYVIQARDNYLIANDNDPHQVLPQSDAQVTFKAGKQVLLLPGFSVGAGANFSAAIDSTLKPMCCTDGGSANCSSCLVDGDEVQSGPGIGAYKVYPGAPNELYVATPHYLFKIHNIGGTGENMFGIEYKNHHFESSSGFPYLLGYQHFVNVITDVHYINGYTFVSFDNGKMLKVNGSGGTGEKMFAIFENSYDIWGDLNYPYYAGDQKFNAGITAVAPIGNSLLIGLANGDLLRVSGVGGTGDNMFDVTEYGSSDTWAFVAAGAYYEGDQRFDNAVTLITPVGGETFIGLGDGKMLKVSGPGGTGHHMFGVAENGSGFVVQGGGGYIGQQKFHGAPVNVTSANGVTFIAMNNGKILKVLGTGGSGQNMFAVDEFVLSFGRTGNYPYYLGDDRFNDVVQDILTVGNSTLLSFWSGRMLKVEGVGGTGNSMFNVVETSRGFGVYDWNYYAYFQGCMNFQRSVWMSSINGVVFLGLSNGKMVKVLGEGGAGENMYALADAGCIQSLCGYRYWIGCENFLGLGAD